MKKRVTIACIITISMIFFTAITTVYFSAKTPYATDFTLKASVEGDFVDNIDDSVKVSAVLKHEIMGFRNGVFSPNKISIFLLPNTDNTLPDSATISLGVPHTILPFERFETTSEFVVDFTLNYVILISSEFIVNGKLVNKSTSFEIVDGKLQHTIPLV